MYAINFIEAIYIIHHHPISLFFFIFSHQKWMIFEFFKWEQEAMNVYVAGKFEHFILNYSIEQIHSNFTSCVRKNEHGRSTYVEIKIHRASSPKSGWFSWQNCDEINEKIGKSTATNRSLYRSYLFQMVAVDGEESCSKKKTNSRNKFHPFA